MREKEIFCSFFRKVYLVYANIQLFNKFCSIIANMIVIKYFCQIRFLYLDYKNFEINKRQPFFFG
jgi:hypothetical protein